MERSLANNDKSVGMLLCSIPVRFGVYCGPLFSIDGSPPSRRRLESGLRACRLNPVVYPTHRRLPGEDLVHFRRSVRYHRPGGHGPAVCPADVRGFSQCLTGCSTRVVVSASSARCRNARALPQVETGRREPAAARFGPRASKRARPVAAGCVRWPCGIPAGIVPCTTSPGTGIRREAANGVRPISPCLTDLVAGDLRLRSVQPPAINASGIS